MIEKQIKLIKISDKKFYCHFEMSKPLVPQFTLDGVLFYLSKLYATGQLDKECVMKVLSNLEKCTNNELSISCIIRNGGG